MTHNNLFLLIFFSFTDCHFRCFTHHNTLPAWQETYSLSRNDFHSYSSSSSSSTRSCVEKIDMEDRNVLAADCIVLCCCCQCMILQIFILILTKLPHKLLKKTKEYAKKFRARKRGTKTMQVEMARNGDDGFRSHGSSFRIDMDDFCLVESFQFGCCMSEIEAVLDDFSSRGEFAFGSFWGGEVSSSRSFRSCFRNDQLDYEVVRYRLMEVFGSADLSYH